MLPTNVGGLTREAHQIHHEQIHTSLNEWLDIRKYGASTAAADNTAAIQSALDAAATQRRLIHIPTGTFKTTGTLLFKSSSCGIVTEPDAIISHTGSGYALVFGNANWPTGGTFSRLLIDGLTIVGSAAGAGGIRSYAAVRSRIQNVVAKGYPNGIGLLFEDHGWINQIQECIIGGCDVGIAFRTTPPTGTYSGNAVTISNVEVSGSRIGIRVGEEGQTAPAAPIAATSLTIREVAIEQIREWGIWIVDGRTIRIRDGYFEDNGSTSDENETGHIRVGNAVGAYPRTVIIEGNQFTNNEESGGRGVLVDNVRRGKIIDNSFYSAVPGNIGVKVNAHTRLVAQDNELEVNVGTLYDGIVPRE